MEGPETTDSPRKKPKFDPSTHNAHISDAGTEASLMMPPPAIPEVIKDPFRNTIQASQDQLMTDASHDQPNTSDNQFSKEAACGITEFVSPDLLGFTGILKKRYTDFLVNEILPSGQVIHLDSLKGPKREKKQEQSNPTVPKSTATAPHKAKDLQLAPEQTPHAENTKPSEIQPAHLPTPNNEEGHSLSSGIFQFGPPVTRTHGVVYDASISPSVPLSMQGFDNEQSPPNRSAGAEEKISPHKRIPPPIPSIPLSMQDFDGKPPESQEENAIRRKETVLIRQTSQGWVEVDEAKEEELKEQKAAEDAAAGLQPKEDIVQDVNTEGSESEVKQPDEASRPSTQAQWQAFASNTPAETGIQLTSEDKTKLLSYFSPEVVNDILALYNRIVNSPHRKTKDYGMVTSAVIDRQSRTNIHQDIRRMFNSCLETMTDNDGAMIITAMAARPAFNARNPRDNNDRGRKQATSRKPGWKELGGEYLHFSLCKENKDTMEAISWLAKQLRMKPASFQFAGTKDRRGVTVQRVSVYRVFIDPMIAAGRSLKNAKIGNFEYKPHPLQLGQLSGNEFIITLRDCDFHYPVPLESKLIVDGAESIVGTAIKNLSERGFINYYGLQRFGTFANSTDTVGIKMLQGDFEGAIDAILDYSPASLAAAQDSMSATDKISMEDKARAHSIHSFKATGRPYPALDNMPRKFSAESNIIRHLGRPGHGTDFLGAIQSIQRNLRLMYVHAYQSLIWNVVASERWKRFGSTVVEGDLVLIDEHTHKIETQMKTEDVDADGEAIIRPNNEDRATNTEDSFTRARALTKEEAESGKYNIFDIVLPTPGYDILYPANEMEKFYEDFMASERGGGLDPHDMRRQWKDVSLSGSYRKLLARPGNDFSFEVKTYKDDDEQFVETDLDRLNINFHESRNGYPKEHSGEKNDAHRVNESKSSKGTNGSKETGEVKHEDSASEDMEPGGVNLTGGPYRDYKIAVILKLQLGSSQYATMALRELMKSGGVQTFKPDFGGGR